MDSTYVSRFYQPGQGTTHYRAVSPSPGLRGGLIQAAAAEAHRHDWQIVYSNSRVISPASVQEFCSLYAEKVIERAEQVIDARIGCRRDFPDDYPAHAGPDGNGDGVIVVILDFPDGVPAELREPVRRLAESGRSNAVALVLVTAEPEAWDFACEPLDKASSR